MTENRTRSWLAPQGAAHGPRLWLLCDTPGAHMGMKCRRTSDFYDVVHVFTQVLRRVLGGLYILNYGARVLPQW